MDLVQSWTGSVIGVHAYSAALCRVVIMGIDLPNLADQSMYAQRNRCIQLGQV